LAETLLGIETFFIPQQQNEDNYRSTLAETLLGIETRFFTKNNRKLKWFYFG
jgi:hypothetical protein